MTCFVFPGQGSQKLGMGAELFDEFSEYVTIADEVLGYSLRTLCLTDPQLQLNQTQFTQPVLFTVEVLQYLKTLQTAAKPNSVAGHSLGEYSALFAAEVFDFATGLALVKKRGELMSQQSGGGMMAVIGLTIGQIRAALAEHGLTTIDIANFNSPVQIVISGKNTDIEAAENALAQARVCIPLNVSAAFHSHYMQQVAIEFKTFLETFKFAAPKIPVIANCTALPYEADARLIRDHLVTQITTSVRWVESVNYIIAQGETEFVEVGPGKVLTNLIKQIRTL